MTVPAAYTNRELDEKFLRIEEKCDDILQFCGRIEDQTKKTNGRVNALELKNAGREGSLGLLIGMGTSIAGLLVAFLSWMGVQIYEMNADVQKVKDTLSAYNIQVIE